MSTLSSGTKRLSSFFNRTPSTTGSTVPLQPNGTPVTTQKSTTPPTLPNKALKDLRDHVKKGLPVTYSTSALLAIVDAIRHSDSIDDRKLLLEQALTFVSKLDDGPIAKTAKNKIIQLLYNDLAHPAATYVGNTHAFRAADGSGNNPDVPDMGKAGAPYSRSVQQGHPLPKNQLPDPGLVFDTLLKRDQFRPHPGGLSALMFNFAPLVIHTVFRTSHSNYNINETSSYVDLAPLYGNNQASQDKIRVRDGRGKLLPDTFCEDRLLLLPPAVCALLVLFNRNHNYIANKLLEINERGTWKDPSEYKRDDPNDKQALLQQEEEIFQIARLVNCGWFGMVVFSDYFSTILGLVRYGSNWSLTPFDEIRLEDHSLFERGKGNSCSVEFNCLYRWHATVSRDDATWTDEVFHHLFGKDATPESVTVDDFKAMAKKAAKEAPPNSQWTFGPLQRQPDGSFRDQDLAKVLQDATEDHAAAFGARGTPATMRLNEVMGIEQSRTWGVCSLNDFRRFLGLKPYESFLEWNPNPEIASAAEKLYGTIEHLELYTGLQAEETKPLVEGAGLCPGYTASRAILSDAIALTRGDRFFTHDFTPANLTSWGFNDCQRDPDAFGFGSTLGRLLLRTLPNDYSENSIYTFFALMTPESMRANLRKMELESQYDLDRPVGRNPVVTLDGYNTVLAALKDKEGFSTPYKARVDRVIQGPGFFPAEGVEQQKAIASVLGTPELVSQIGQYFYNTTRRLIDQQRYTLVGDVDCGVDIVRDVIRPAVVSWVATDLAGIQLKTGETNGPYTPAELYDALEQIYQFIFLDVEPSKVMVLQAKVKRTVNKLGKLVKGGVSGAVGSRLSIAGIIDSVSTIFSKNKKAEYHDIVRRLYELGHSTDQLVNTLLALMVTSTIELTIAATNALNLYIGTKDAAALTALTKSDSEQLNGFVYESLRVDPPFRGVFRIAKKNNTISGKSILAGDRVFLNLADANLDPTVFSNPDLVNVTRGPKNILFDDGVFTHLGEGLSVKIITEILRAVFSLNDVRRAPGQSGVLQRFKDPARPEIAYAYLDSTQNISESPQSLLLLFSSNTQL